MRELLHSSAQLHSMYSLFLSMWTINQKTWEVHPLKMRLSVCLCATSSKNGPARAQVRPDQARLDQTPCTPTLYIPHSSTSSSLTLATHTLRTARTHGQQAGKQARNTNNNTSTTNTPYIHIKHKMPSQWNTDGRICRLPMPRIPRLGAKARDAGVYFSGGLVNTKMITAQQPRSNERPMDNTPGTPGVLCLHNRLSIASP